MKFQPGNKFGQGRPRGPMFVQSCREWADQNGWQKLEKMAESDNPRIALEAIKVLLAYGYGKPKESVEVYSAPSQHSIDFSRISTATLEKFIDENS